MSEPLAVLVLAAGLGTRLRPYTELVPKPLVPVVDKTMLAHQMTAVSRLRTCIQVDRVFANAHHLADQVQEVAGPLGIDQVMLEHPQILGTGGPLHRIWAEGWRGELLVLNSDNYHAFHLAQFVSAARDSDAPFALFCVDHARTNFLECDARGYVCGREGKYSVGSFVRKMTFSGVSWYSADALARISAQDFNVVDFWKREAENGVLPLAYTAQSQAVWIDMGTPQSLYDACATRLLELGVDRWVDRWVNMEGVSLGLGAVVCAGAWVGPDSSLRHCVLLPDARVEPGTQLEKCVVGPGFRWNL
ncbi:MAG TPA: sugar phosphate nucleotidyltransferase [Fibrobacteraceae bacterium]|nr:sugar phosphate nucleotidyltransferase [Fibrobacteraceae bacterium]